MASSCLLLKLADSSSLSRSLKFPQPCCRDCEVWSELRVCLCCAFPPDMGVPMRGGPWPWTRCPSPGSVPSAGHSSLGMGSWTLSTPRGAFRDPFDFTPLTSPLSPLCSISTSKLSLTQLRCQSFIALVASDCKGLTCPHSSLRSPFPLWVFGW